MPDLGDFSSTFIWCVHQNFLPLRLIENQRASFSSDRSNSWFTRTMSSEGTLHPPPYVFHSCPFHVGISLCMGKRAMGMFEAAYGFRKPKLVTCANANFVAL